jgi:DNA-binding Lrp family transcriptional regulator
LVLPVAVAVLFVFLASYFLVCWYRVVLWCSNVGKLGQKYLVMIKISPNMAAKLYEPLMEFSEMPIEGVTLEEAYQVFGKWDFAVLFKADSNQDALNFVSDRIRLVEGVTETFTIPLSPIKDYRIEK